MTREDKFLLERWNWVVGRVFEGDLGVMSR